MKILTFSTLYPNAARPGHGIFVETRLRHLLASGAVQSRVVAPVPWFPFKHPAFGEYAIHAKVPREEERYGIQIVHPRYPVLPKIGMTLAPLLLARAAASAVEREVRDSRFDIIDAHYFYPDGVAAVMLGRRFGKPVVITARGTDVNVIPDYRMPRRLILNAALRAAGLITVSHALKQKLVALGLPPARIEVLRNGVDLHRFQPVDRRIERARLGLQRPTLLSVGNLVPIKGHDLVIDALRQLDGCDLIIVGEGPERAALIARARKLGLTDRVRFIGAIPQEDLTRYYGAADVLVLASSREGWANVLLESIACGTPVVASDVGGNREVVAAPEAGLVIPERTPQEIARAVRVLLAQPLGRDATRGYAERFSWDSTTAGQLRLFEAVLAGRPASGMISDASESRDRMASGARG